MILVTGGCGYIGSHVVKRLSEAGEEVVVIDNLSQGQRSALLHNEKLLVGDITDRDFLQQVFDTHNIEVVIHLAALVNAAESKARESEYRAVNEQGTKNIWEIGRQVGVLNYLYASSAAVYGNTETTSPTSESYPTIPSNVYGETKLAGEISLKNVIGESGRYGIFRFFNVAGAEPGGRLGQSRASRAIMQRIYAVAAGEDPELVISGSDYDTKDGTVERDYIHVEDIAAAFLLAVVHLRSNKPSFTLNLGSGTPHTILDIVRVVETITGKTVAVKHADRIQGDIARSLADNTKAKETLGWSPSKTFDQIVQDGWNRYTKS